MEDSKGSVEVKLDVKKSEYDELIGVLDKAGIDYDRGCVLKRKDDFLGVYIESGVDTENFGEKELYRLIGEIEKIDSVKIGYFIAEIIEYNKEISYYKTVNGKLVEVVSEEILTGIDTF